VAAVRTNCEDTSEGAVVGETASTIVLSIVVAFRAPGGREGGMLLISIDPDSLAGLCGDKAAMMSGVGTTKMPDF
jgi:hypothetical protein